MLPDNPASSYPHFEALQNTLDSITILETHESWRSNREIWASCCVNNANCVSAKISGEPRHQSSLITLIENGDWSNDKIRIKLLSDILKNNPSQPCVIFLQPRNKETFDDYIAKCSWLWEILAYPNVRIMSLGKQWLEFFVFGIGEGDSSWDHRYFKNQSWIDKNSFLSYLDHQWWDIPFDERNPEGMTDDFIANNVTIRSIINNARKNGIGGDDRAILRQIRARKTDESIWLTTEIPENHGILNTVCIDWDGTLFGEMRNESQINTEMLDEALEKAQENNLSLTIWTGGGWETIQKIYATPELKQYFEKYPWLHVVHKSDCRGWTLPYVFDDSTTEELTASYGVSVQNHLWVGNKHEQVARSINRQREAALRNLQS